MTIPVTLTTAMTGLVTLTATKSKGITNGTAILAHWSQCVRLYMWPYFQRIWCWTDL